MVTQTLKQQCIEHLTEIGQPDQMVFLTQDEVDFLEVDLWDQSDVLEEGGQNGK